MKKEHGTLWCVDRELKAAEREKRAPDLSKAPPGREAANTPIPHNVIEMMQPAARAFDAAEATLRETFERETAQLKEQQKQERFAFFEDGKRLFRATRVEVYKEVKASFARPGPRSTRTRRLRRSSPRPASAMRCCRPITSPGTASSTEPGRACTTGLPLPTTSGLGSRKKRRCWWRRRRRLSRAARRTPATS